MKEKRPFRLPPTGQCFICAPQSGSGVDIQFLTDGEKVYARTRLSKRHQGPPGHAHGGVLLAILDEAMGACAWVQGHSVLAAHVEMDFKLPVPLEQEIEIEAEIVKKEGRKIFTQGVVRLNSQKVAALAKGIFVEHKKFFEKFTQGTVSTP